MAIVSDCANFSKLKATRLFVINHRSDDHVIELFDLREGRLFHLRTIRGELLASPNDLLAVGPQRSYAVNHHGSRTSLGKVLEDYLRLPRSNVVYFDGTGLNVAAERILYANGINWSSDGGTGLRGFQHRIQDPGVSAESKHRDFGF